MRRQLNIEDTIPFQMYPTYEPILDILAEDLFFDYQVVDRLSCGRSKYQLSDICFGTKAFVDDFIANGRVNNSANRAKVLYNLYACRWLMISDIKYPTYLDWKYSHCEMSLDHVLPKKYFPLLTFDCSNWQPLSVEQNQTKGVEFISEGKAAITEIKTDIEAAFNEACLKILS